MDGKISGTKLNAAKRKEKVVDEKERRKKRPYEYECYARSLHWNTGTGNLAHGTVAIYPTLTARLHMILLQE